MGKANGVASAEKAAGQDSSGSAPAAGNAGLQWNASSRELCVGVSYWKNNKNVNPGVQLVINARVSWLCV